MHCTACGGRGHLGDALCHCQQPQTWQTRTVEPGSPEVRLGCGIEGMAGLNAGSVNLVLCDLPSGETRAVFDKPVIMGDFWHAARHALADDGTVVLLASSFRFAATLVKSQPAWFRYDLVWSKSLATGHLNAAHRPLRSHEFILVFSRKVATYNPQMLQGASPIHAARRAHHGENYGPQTRVNESRASATDRYPVSVLEFASVGTSSKARIHPQQKPVPLLDWLIRTYTNKGDAVVDPCAGSGSTGVAALAAGRRFLGWDKFERFANTTYPSTNHL